MWKCPKCENKVEESFDVCWSCGTTREGIEDPGFVTADDAEPIPDPPTDRLASTADDPFDDFAGTPWPELVECYMAANTIEAKFVADRLMEQGIPAIADRQDINSMMGGFQPHLWGYGPKVRIRPKDVPKAAVWLEAFERQKKSRLENESAEST